MILNRPSMSTAPCSKHVFGNVFFHAIPSCQKRTLVSVVFLLNAGYFCSILLNAGDFRSIQQKFGSEFYTL